MLSRKLKQLCFPVYTLKEVLFIIDCPHIPFNTGRAFSYGLNWALAGRGVVVNDKAFQNLTTSELQQKGATIAESLSGLPVYVRGNLLGGSSDISKAQYAKLLKQVTAHLSSIANVFVQDGAVGSSSECDAKVRVISDSPSAVLKLSSILWKTPSRAVSHDSCPLTVYVTTSISPGVVNAVGLRAQGDNGFIAADIERSSLILCGKGFSDANGVKEALAALSGPVIIARGGLLLCASSGIIPSVAKLSPGQAAYHFLAGYQNGKFFPAYSKFAYIDALELAKAFMSKLKDHQILSYLVNAKKGETSITGKDLLEMVPSMLAKNFPPFEPKGGELQEKYKSFLLSKFRGIPKGFSF